MALSPAFGCAGSFVVQLQHRSGFTCGSDAMVVSTEASQGGPLTAIAGVSTSVTAFVGATAAGPFNAPIRCLSYRDYELNFGGLDVESEVSYAVAQFFLNSGREAVVVRHDPDADDGWLTSIRALDGADMLNLVCLPGVSDPIVLGEAMTYSRARRAFLIVDAPRAADTPDDMLALMSGADLPKSNCAAIYYPWLYVSDPMNSGSPRLVAPSGTIAGLYARHDASRGVWKAPAGTHAPLVGVQSVAHAVTDSENAMLNPRGVNCIRVVPSVGTVAWGARTLEGDDRAASEWKYIPVRRTALLHRRELGSGPQVGRLRSERRASLGADSPERRRVHAHELSTGGISGADSTGSVFRQV